MQLTDDWERQYHDGETAWEDEETVPATQDLLLQHLPPPGQSVLEIGCGRGVDSVWLAEQGYQVIACDISATAIHHARKRAQEHHVAIDFRVVDVLREHAALLRFQVVFERGLLHAFVSEEGRLTFARTVARLLESGGIWLSLAGAAATLLEAQAAAWRLEACLSASQITEAVEPYFDIVSIRRVRYGRGGVTDFPAFASALRKRDLADPG